MNNLQIGAADLDPILHFSAWAARAAYQLPLEIFTPNYDLLLETGLETLRAPYFDGFVGNIQARFHTDLVESFSNSENECVPSFFLRLWKLHGSVNWQRLPTGDIVRLGHEKSSKHRKAEDLIAKGALLRIIRETDFQELVALAHWRQVRDEIC